MDKRPDDDEMQGHFRAGVFQCFTCAGCHDQWTAPGKATASAVLPADTAPGEQFMADMKGFDFSVELTFLADKKAGDVMDIPLETLMEAGYFGCKSWLHR